jgi:putative transposase
MAQSITLTPSALAALEQAAAEAESPDLRRRAEALCLLHAGQSVTQVAQRLGVSRRSIFHWIARYRAEGLDGLRTKPRSGRPRITDDHYRTQLKAMLARSPRDYGCYMHVWIVGWLAQYLQDETGVCPSASTLRALMHELGYVFSHKPGHYGWHYRGSGVVSPEAPELPASSTRSSS